MEYLLIFSVIFLIVSFFVDRRKMSVLISCFMMVIVLVLLNPFPYADINKLFYKELRHDPHFASVTFTIYDISGFYPKPKYQTTIYDPEIVEEFVSKLKKVRVRREWHDSSFMREYSMTFNLKNELADKVYENTYITVYWNQHTLMGQEIVMGSKYLNHIVTAVQQLNLDWEEVLEF